MTNNYHASLLGYLTFIFVLTMNRNKQDEKMRDSYQSYVALNHFISNDKAIVKINICYLVLCLEEINEVYFTITFKSSK